MPAILSIRRHSNKNNPSLILPSFKSLASAVGQKTPQRPAGIASFFHNQKWKTNKGKKRKHLNQKTASFNNETAFKIY